MTENPELNELPLVKLAERINGAVATMINELSEEMGELRDEVSRISRLVDITEKSERAVALGRAELELENAILQQERVRRHSGFLSLKAPIEAVKALLDVRRARAELAEAELEFNSAPIKAERAERIATHNRFVAAERARLAALRQKLDTCQTADTLLAQFRHQAGDAISAAGAGGWVAADFPARFRNLARLVFARDIAAAIEETSKLVFQRRPPASTYLRWATDALAIREQAYSGHAGMAASGAYIEVAARSINLAAAALRLMPSQKLTSFPHPADQWQVLSLLLADPRQLKTDALWAVYWSMFKCAQWMANTLFEADAHEDVFNGKFSAQIDRQLNDWAAERVREFGYPQATSYMGTLEIASTPEESRVGADIGLIVEINIGDLVCRKVALFQAKKSKHGVADLGSKTGQLRKLAEHPRMGFYLFYHQFLRPLCPPAPTVVSAQELGEAAVELGKSLDATSLSLNVRTMGWDWASFVSFGLCQPGSAIGESFTTAADALDKLGGGNQGNLPKYLHLIAIADEGRVLRLREQIREHYQQRTKTVTRDNPRERSNTRDIGDRGHSMGL